eukprot:COSAG01_NODE_72596_length_252_cov_1.339869_1_plen_25_part_10
MADDAAYARAPQALTYPDLNKNALR